MDERTPRGFFGGEVVNWWEDLVTVEVITIYQGLFGGLTQYPS